MNALDDADDRESRIQRRLAEIRKDPAARSWGGLRRQAEDDVDAEDAARRSAIRPSRLKTVWAPR